MLKKVKDSTIAILKNNALNKLNINRKIKQDDIDIILLLTDDEYLDIDDLNKRLQL